MAGVVAGSVIQVTGKPEFEDGSILGNYIRPGGMVLKSPGLCLVFKTTGTLS